MEEVPWWLSLIVSWIPMITIILGWIWGAKIIAGSLRCKDGRSVGQTIDDFTKELKRSNDLRERASKNEKSL